MRKALFWLPCVLLVSRAALAGLPGPDVIYPARIAKGPKMRLAAATYFGGTGTESIAGLVCRVDGTVIAYGNSWGPPFPPVPAAPVVLGSDAPRNLPLFAAGTPGDDWPHDALPPSHHADRTGFLVCYSADLATVVAAVRFGWGAATVDAAVLTPDGALVTAGAARQGFRALADGAAQVRRLPPGSGPGYGAVAHADVEMPGDIYVAAWRSDLKGFAWVWILEKHADPPPRLFAAADGRVIFECRGVKTIGPDGRSLTSIPLPAPSPENEDRFLAAVGGPDDALLFAGWTASRSGSREWMGPLVELRGADGTLRGRYYDWRAALAGQPTIDLTAAAGITQADLLASGHVVVGAPCHLGRSVLERTPTDITAMAPRRAVLADELVRFGNRSPWGAGLRFSLACFDPSRTNDCTFGYWVGVSPEGRSPAAEELTLDGLRAPDANCVAVWGMSGGALLRTLQVESLGTNATVIANWRRKPAIPYLTVFSRDFSQVLWSSLVPRCRVAGVASGPRGLVVAATSRAPWKYELYAPLQAAGAQDSYGGGYADGRLLLLEGPK